MKISSFFGEPFFYSLDTLDILTPGFSLDYKSTKAFIAWLNVTIHN